MSFLKSLFSRGGGEDKSETGNAASRESYEGYTITAVEMRSGREYQLAGMIEKEIGGVTRSARFIRADTFPSVGDAAAAALRKGRQLIDEQGDGVFG